MENSSIDALNCTTAQDRRGLAGIIVYSTLIFAIIVIAIIGNIAVIVAVYTNRHLREDLSNMFIVSLSVTDLSSASIVMTAALGSVAADRWPFGEVWCGVVCYANFCLIAVSMLNLCCISINRYIAIVHALRYNALMTKKTVWAMIGYTWIQGIILSSVPNIFDLVHYDYWEAICSTPWHRERDKLLIPVIIAYSACFLLPGIILFACYSRILTTLKKQQQAIPAHIQGSQNEAYANSKIIRSLMVVVVAYFICLTPFTSTKLYKTSVEVDNALPGYVNLTTSVLGYLSSAVNPLIYGIFRKDFRKAYKLLFLKFIVRRSVLPMPRHE